MRSSPPRAARTLRAVRGSSVIARGRRRRLRGEPLPARRGGARQVRARAVSPPPDGETRGRLAPGVSLAPRSAGARADRPSPVQPRLAPARLHVKSCGDWRWIHYELGGHRQLADSLAGCVEDSVGDRRCDADLADLTDAFDAERVDPL